MAEEAAGLFGTTYPNFYAVTDDHTQISRAAIACPGDVILYFSYSGATKELMDLLPVAHTRKVIVILITRFPNSPGAQLADLVLQCGANESALQLGSAEAKIAQICLLEIIHTEMCRHANNSVYSRYYNNQQLPVLRIDSAVDIWRTELLHRNSNVLHLLHSIQGIPFRLRQCDGCDLSDCHRNLLCCPVQTGERKVRRDDR